MAEYRRANGASTGLARPRPLHALTPAAEEARESMRRLAIRQRLDGEVAQIVTDVGRPRYDGDPVTASARSLLAAAGANGWRTHLEVGSDFCSVHGAHSGGERVGFTATWRQGRADSARWRSPWRYELIHDERPVGVAKITRTGLSGKRAAGVDVEHLAIVASPWGVPISFAELKRRIAASDCP